MISTRYANPTIAILILALIPTLLHSYIGATIQDGKSVKQIPSTLGNFSSIPAKRNSQWGMDIFASEDWFERNYQNSQDRKVRLFTARSYDHKRLYHHPELALSYGFNLGKKDIVTLPDYPEIPVHILSNKDNSMLVAYVLLYNDQFVKAPIDHQFRNSMRLLFNARKPMTLFYASQSKSPANSQFEQSAIASLLSLAIQSFQTQAAHALKTQ